MSRARKTVAVIAKFAVSAACVVAIARKIDTAALGQDLAHLHWPWLAAALCQFALLPMLGGYRWHVVLDSLGIKLSMSVAIRLFWIGMAFSQILPSISGGDAVRVIWAWRRGIPLHLATQSVILERIAMVGTLVLIVVLMQMTGEYRIPGSPLIFPLMILGVLVGLGLSLGADRILMWLPAWRITKLASALAANSRRVYRNAHGVRLTLGSLAGHANISLGCLWLGLSLGMPLHLPDYLFYVSLVTLLSTLPLSIGGWGIREGAVVYLFSALGIASHTALAFSILFGLSVAAISIFGIAYLWRTDAVSLSVPIDEKPMPDLNIKNI